MSERIGFVGLGVMGTGMVRNLLSAGHALAVWNRDPTRAELLAAAGAQAVGSLGALGAVCSLVMLCVSDTAAVESITVGEGGLAASMGAGGLLVDLSTISPQATRQLAATLSERDLDWLDAPVSGGSEGAAAGTLSAMVGGSGESLERARPYLEAFCQRITHIAPNGDGQMAKLVNQILVVGYALAIGEAFIFAQAGGLDLQRTFDAVSGGAAGSWMLSNRASQMLVRDFSPGFTVDLQLKDVRLALAEAERLGIPTITTGIAESLYRVLQKDGLGGEGNHALVKALERLSGVVVDGR
ncbi:MAG TPA: NAD(P)-dependent oxidoreductase [Anaerolineales bacterium]